MFLTPPPSGRSSMSKTIATTVRTALPRATLGETLGFAAG
jgi:hypothetical protein